ncbi:small multi-drug export protein [Thermogladius sp. KZ2Tp1]|uniref:COG2426 family protein n=1 Tax=Thermogladius sp. KZ2Tp1 TaxID=3136289 RepID=UPI003DA9B03B
MFHVGSVAYELLLVLLVGFSPVAEIRGAIPLAYYFFRQDQALYMVALAAGLLGNLAVAPIAVLALRFVERKIVNNSRAPGFLKRLYWKVVDYARKKARGHEKLEFAGLAVFVAIPLPGTGAWTGALVAHVLGMDLRKGVLSIELGVLGAFLIVLAVVETGATVLRVFFGL